MANWLEYRSVSLEEQASGTLEPRPSLDPSLTSQECRTI